VPQFPGNIDLSSLDGATGFKLSGTTTPPTGDASGLSVASAGDVNGDGFADVIVGAHLADPHGTNSGASYVIFGHASGFAANIDLSSLDGTAGFKLSGATAYDFTGRSVASAGDVNGDGFADLIVGALGADPNGVSNSGASYVVFGKASGFAANIDLSSLDGMTGFKLSGAAADDRSGRSVASAGDVNGDGFADLIVGADGADPHGSFSGASYVVFGQPSGFAANIDLSTLNGTTGFKLSGAAAGDRSCSVASAGDVNGDGFADLMVGAYSADPHGQSSGASYVVFGKSSGFAANVDLSTLDGTSGFRLSGAAGELAGYSLASAGDVNGDGFADLIIGARGAIDRGASYVVFGKASGFAANIDLSSLDGATGFKINGAAAGDAAGYSVASAGDVNGDGFADLLVGAPRAAAHGTLSGASFVVFGRASGFPANFNLLAINVSTGFKLSGAAAYDMSGMSVASAGDVNGDGLADLIVGAFGADAHGTDSGASYVVFAKLPDTAVSRTGTAASQTLAGGDFNDTLSGLGGDDTLHGNGGNDSLDGGAGDDTIIGGAGNDTMIGGLGNDTYVVDSSNDLTVENANEGIDTVQASTHYQLSATVENLTLLGSADLQAYGNSASNTLTSNTGVNLLAGGDGDDIYVVNNTSDAVLENANEGTDTVQATVDFRLSANVENLALLGSANLQAYGNAGANVIISNSGIDLLVGGAGDDTYIVNNTSDAVLENANEGTDTVQATVHFRLAANVENLTLLGTANLQAYGNALANTLISNTGIDLLAGGDGDDTYVVNNANDAVLENANEGIDTVHATVHYRLSANVENLLLDGSADLQGYGHALANILASNAGINLLVGGDGDDTYVISNGADFVLENANEGIDAAVATVHYRLSSNVETLVLQGSADLQGYGNGAANMLFGNSGVNLLDGGGGADMLTGNAGNDAFLFHAGEADGDTVVDFSAGDVLLFAGFGAGTFTQVGATNQWQITSAIDAHVETLTLANGSILTPADYAFL